MYLKNNIEFFMRNILNLDLENDFIFIKDLKLKYIYANSKFCKLFQINLNVLIGKDDSYFIKDHLILKNCNESDSLALKNNFLISEEEVFGLNFKVLKLKINIDTNTFALLCFAKNTE